MSDVPISFAVLALFLAVLALLVAPSLAARHGGRRAPFILLGALFLAVALVVLVSGP